jgi:hypothetical protein
VSKQPISASTAIAPASLRVAGQHARATQHRYAHRAVIAIFATTVTIALAIALLGFGWLTAGVEAGMIAAMLAIDSWASPLVDRWGRGAAGEEQVGHVLDGLREQGWLALHDVTVERGNVDHVLIGPAGIFTIETKSHRGRINADTIDVRMLRQAYAESKAIERVTGLRVEPLLVFSNAYLIPGISHRNGVAILPARMLTRYLLQRRGNIPSARVNEVYTRLAASLPG